MPTRTHSRPARRATLAALALAIACVGAAAPTRAPTPAPTPAPHVDIPDGVAAYSQAIAHLLQSHGKDPVEPVFELGMKASPGLQAVLPQLSESQYQQVQRDMQGFMVARIVTVVVLPSVYFFRDLARKQGTKADRAFFEIYDGTEPDSNGGFPAYVQQQTDEAGCTRFDNKIIVDVYRGWLTFRTAHPDAYAAEAQGEIDSLETELLAGICSCANAKKTAAGLQAFVKAFPNVPITPKIKARIAQIRSGKSKFRFDCHAG